jgi:hypothetical protein
MLWSKKKKIEIYKLMVRVMNIQMTLTKKEGQQEVVVYLANTVKITKKITCHKIEGKKQIKVRNKMVGVLKKEPIVEEKYKLFQ